MCFGVLQKLFSGSIWLKFICFWSIIDDYHLVTILFTVTTEFFEFFVFIIEVTKFRDGVLRKAAISKLYNKGIHDKMFCNNLSRF